MRCVLVAALLVVALPLPVGWAAGAEAADGLVQASGNGAASTERGGGRGAVVPDPGAWGRYMVDTATYDLGDRAFKVGIAGMRAELAGVVHYPHKPRGKRLPLVVFLHGLNSSCADTHTTYPDWPCHRGSRPIPNHRGYDYVGRRLASHGYVVVSISANGVNASDAGGPSRAAMTARGRLLQKHLDLWHTWATKGGRPFGTRFRKAIDFTRVGTMGHSRGGEGVVRNYQINAKSKRPYGIHAVLALDPADFYRPIVTKATMATVLAMCGFKGGGVEYYDDARYRPAGRRWAKHTVAVLGANHNNFNTVWSPGSSMPEAGDDWSGGRDSACHPSRETRLTAARQRKVGVAYIAGFFRRYLGGERALAPLWRGETGPPPSAASAKVLLSYLAPQRLRRDINRLLTSSNLRRNTMGGKVRLIGFGTASLCGGPRRTTCLHKTKAPATEPHMGQKGPGLSILKLGWSRPRASFINTVPCRAADVARYRALVMRAALDFTDPRNPKGRAQNLRLTVTDRRGHKASVPVARYSAALDYPPPTSKDEDKPFLLNQIRVPLSAFQGVDMHRVRSVSLDFGITRRGSIGITDLAFTD